MKRLTHYFQELMHLKVVLEQGSINRAAAQIGLTQPALTRSIGRLEAALGVQLLNRTPRGVFPTTYAEAMVAHLKLIDTELEKATVELESLKYGNGGQLTCGGTIGAVNWLFARAITHLNRKRPKLRIRVVESFPGNLLSMLRTGELDVVVCAKTNDLLEADLSGEAIAQDHVGLFAAKGSHFLKRGPLSLKEVNASAQWILPNWSGGFYRLVRQRFEAAGIKPPENAIETSSSMLLRGLLRTNDRAVAITTSHVVDSELRTGGILELNGDWSFFHSNTMIYQRANIVPPVQVKLFIQSIKSAVKFETEH